MTSGKHPDIPAIVRAMPHKVAVYYRGILYRWKQCGYVECARWFWKNYTNHRNRDHGHGKHKVYCCDECRLANWKILNRERQRRWKKRQVEGLIR
jgi:hypothetical protein